MVRARTKEPLSTISLVSLTEGMLMIRMRARRREKRCLPKVMLSRNGKRMKRRQRLPRR